MKRGIPFMLMGLIACAIGGDEADGRGFGGGGRGGGGGGREFGGGGGGYSGSRSSSFSGSQSSSFSGSRSAGGGHSGYDSFSGSRSSSGSASKSSSYGGWNHSSSASASGSRSGSAAAGGGRAAAGGSYNREVSGSRGGSASVSGERGVAAGPNGAVAGSSRDVTATGAGGKTYSSSSKQAAAVGPYGRAVGGSQGSAAVSGSRGAASANWQSAYASGGHMSTDFGMAHYSSGSVSGARYGTSYRSASVVTAQSTAVRTNFGYASAFHPAWNTSHPGAWYAAGWSAGSAWKPATWAAVTAFCSIPASAPINYDYGSNVVINDNSVTVNGEPAGTAQDYSTQATAIATKGQTDPPMDAEWKPLGVFSLIQGDEKQSNNIFQLAVSKAGIIRGNYYDGLMDTTTPVYGSVDPKTQRAAWSIGKKTDRVFEAGVSNLTAAQSPVLIHIGKDQTQQWLLVRQEQGNEEKK